MLLGCFLLCCPPGLQIQELVKLDIDYLLLDITWRTSKNVIISSTQNSSLFESNCMLRGEFLLHCYLRGLQWYKLLISTNFISFRPFYGGLHLCNGLFPSQIQVILSWFLCCKARLSSFTPRALNFEISWFFCYIFDPSLEHLYLCNHHLFSRVSNLFELIFCFMACLSSAVTPRVLNLMNYWDWKILFLFGHFMEGLQPCSPLFSLQLQTC
jgi:hypothetical protein